MADERRAGDRRQGNDPNYAGPDRRQGERRQPIKDMSDEALTAAFEQTDGEGPRAETLLEEILARGLAR